MEPDLHQCPNCERWNVRRNVERDSFPYLDHSIGQTVRLTFTTQMFTCKDCGLKYTDEAGEDARTAAVRAYLSTRTRE